MIKELFGHLIISIRRRLNNLENAYIKSEFCKIAPDAIVVNPDFLSCGKKIVVGKNSHIFGNAKFIISNYSEEGRLVLKNNVCVAQGLTVVTGSHKRTVGKIIKDNMLSHNGDTNNDVIIEDDVWIGTNVTLLAGVHIGRGANIGAGAIVRNNVPPYSIVIGNPSKVIGFCFTPDEVIEHEKKLYPESQRLSVEELEINYNKFFLKRLKDIKEFTKM